MDIDFNKMRTSSHYKKTKYNIHQEYSTFENIIYILVGFLKGLNDMVIISMSSINRITFEKFS